jgi:hypothetical protein
LRFSARSRVGDVGRASSETCMIGGKLNIREGIKVSRRSVGTTQNVGSAPQPLHYPVAVDVVVAILEQVRSPTEEGKWARATAPTTPLSTLGGRTVRRFLVLEAGGEEKVSLWNQDKLRSASSCGQHTDRSAHIRSNGCTLS